MKKNLPIIIIAVLVVLVGGYFLMSGKSDSTSKTKMNNDELVVEEGSEGFVGSIQDALSRGVAMKCSWEQGDMYDATAYINKDKVYYENTAEGKTSHMISKDNCVWSWSEGEQGLKICYEPEEVEENEIPDEANADFGSYEFNCVPATVADSQFVPPANVEFLDPMQMMPEGFEMPGQ